MDNANMQFLTALILDGLMGIACGWALRWWFHSSRNKQMERGLHESQAQLKNAGKNIAAIKEAAADVAAALAARTDELALARANNCQLRDMISQKTWRVVALEARVAELEPYLTRPVYPPTQLAGLSSTSIGLEFPAVPVSRS
jgi:hypothetical protein